MAGTLVVFSSGSITVDVVRDRIGVRLVDDPVDRSVAVDPDVSSAHVDNEQKTAL